MYHYNQVSFHLGGGGRLLIADDIEEVAEKQMVPKWHIFT